MPLIIGISVMLLLGVFFKFHLTAHLYVELFCATLGSSLFFLFQEKFHLGGGDKQLPGSFSLECHVSVEGVTQPLAKIRSWAFNLKILNPVFSIYVTFWVQFKCTIFSLQCLQLHLMRHFNWPNGSSVGHC